jgi:hypothetical protein
MFNKKKKDADLFINAEEDWTQHDQDESILSDDDLSIDELPEEDEELTDIESDDPDEIRYQQHLKLKKQDKIFNNTYGIYSWMPFFFTLFVNAIHLSILI